MWNCYLLQILFSLMFTPEAAAAPRWPWSPVLLPQRSRAPATQFTVLKLENKSKRNRISNSLEGEWRFYWRHLTAGCFCDTALLMAPAWHRFPSSFSNFASTLTVSLFPPKDAAKLDLDGNLNVVSLWKEQHEGAVGLLALIVTYCTFVLVPFTLFSVWLLDSWHHFK